MNLFKFGHSLVDKMRNLFKEDLPSHVISGLTAPTDASLTHTIAAGVASVDGYRVALSATGHTYTASRDTYVDLSNIGVLTFVEVANLAAEPAVTPDSVRFLKVVTDGTSITASDRFKGTGILNAGVVVPLGRMATSTPWDRVTSGAAQTGISTLSITHSLGTVTAPAYVWLTATAVIQNLTASGLIRLNAFAGAGSTAGLESAHANQVLENETMLDAAIINRVNIGLSGLIKVTTTGVLNLEVKIARQSGTGLFDVPLDAFGSALFVIPES